MRHFAIAAITLIFIASPATGNQQQGQSQEKQSGATVASNPSGGVTVIVNQPSPTPQAQSAQAKTHNWYEWFWRPIWSNWGIVLIAAIAAKAAFASLDEIKKQAVSTEKSAKAASENAEAVMRGERAWLLIDGIEVEPGFLKWSTPHFNYRVVNFGRTPGFMISAKAYFQLSDNTSFPQELTFMDIKGGMAQEAVVIPHGEPLPLMGNDPILARYEIDAAERTRIFETPPRLFLWACGSIYYHDVFGKVRSTPFAYWYSVSQEKFVRNSTTPDINKPT
jgi:hypothetical protein